MNGGKVEFLLAQHLQDPLRMEPRNVGVIMKMGVGSAGQSAALVSRFIGESEDGRLDKRKLKLFQSPEVYEQWVEYWKSVIETGNWDELLTQGSSSHYRLVPGGEVSDVNDDEPKAVAEYLYSLLVSEGGFAEALGAAEERVDFVRLRDTVTSKFRELSMLIDDEGATLNIQYPIRRNVQIRGGSSQPHKPAFVQQNGKLFVMETIDFRVKMKDRVKDHAGWAAYMYKDLRDYHTDVVGISIVQSPPPSEIDENVEYAMSILTKESDQVVDWANESSRTEFLKDRERIASGE